MRRSSRRGGIHRGSRAFTVRGTCRKSRRVAQPVTGTTAIDAAPAAPRDEGRGAGASSGAVISRRAVPRRVPLVKGGPTRGRGFTLHCSTGCHVVKQAAFGRDDYATIGGGASRGGGARAPPRGPVRGG